MPHTAVGLRVKTLLHDFLLVVIMSHVVSLGLYYHYIIVHSSTPLFTYTASVFLEFENCVGVSVLVNFSV